MSAPEETRRYYGGHPDGGRRDVDGVEWFLTDGYDGWFRWEGKALIRKPRPKFPETPEPNDPVLAAIQAAEEAAKEVSQIAGARLRAIWNPETRRYEPHEEMVVLHDLVNKNLSTWNRLRSVKDAYLAVRNRE
jgi:hypothetical protein